MSDGADEVVTFAFRELAANYASFAGAAVYLYDILLTFDDEISFFWNAKGGWLINTLFLANRYLPLVNFASIVARLNPSTLSTPMYALLDGQLSVDPLYPSRCKFAFVGGTVTKIVGIIVATAIFCLRVCTVYKDSLLTRIIVIASFWISFLLLVTFGGIGITWLGAWTKFAGGRCTLDFPLQRFAYMTSGVYLAPLLCETVILIATAKHAFSTRQNRRILDASTISPILDRLYHDGFAYFVIVFILRLFCYLAWLFCPPGLKHLADHFEYYLTSVATSRFFLALRSSIVGFFIHSRDSTTYSEEMDGMVVFKSASQGMMAGIDLVPSDSHPETSRSSKVSTLAAEGQGV